MPKPAYSYCTACGTRGDAETPACERCGSRREPSRGQRRSGVAFLLNELTAFPMSQVLTIQQRSRVESHYEGELAGLIGATPSSASVAPARPLPAITRPPSPPRQRQAPINARPAPPAQPKRDFDWSWLAEQQANLFLFAGAFLTVVAALIYVGYSGEAVSGGLKMALLSTYTLAFLAAGVLCTRIKRVATAGRVFFGVGAILFPLNFVAARTIFGEEQFSTESMWLLGSVASAAFYTAVAYIGLGRIYAFSAGTALASATLASAVVFDVPFEWAPAFFVALAMAMSLTSIAGPTRLRERIGSIWMPQAHALAAMSALAAMITALWSQNGDLGADITTAWFLPITFAGLALYAGTHMLATRDSTAGIAAIAGFGVAFVAIVFAAGAPAEYYAVILGALAVTFGGAMVAVNQSAQAGRLPKQFDEMLRVAGIIATGAAVLFGLLLLQASEGAEPSYTLQTRWFVAATFALMVPFYTIDAFVRRERTGVAGLVTATAGTSVGVVFGFDLSAEYYAFGLLLPALAFAIAARWGDDQLLGRLHDEWRDDAFILGYVGIAAAAVIGCMAALAGVQAQSDELVSTTYEPQFRAFLPLVWVGAIVFAAIDASRGMRFGVVACALSVLAIGGAIVYMFDPSAEYYAFGFLFAALVLAVASRFATNMSALNLDAHWRGDTFIVGRIGAALGTGIALGAVLAAINSTAGSYEPTGRWFLPTALALATIFAALDASSGRRVETSSAFFAGIIATALGVMYGLEAAPAYYGGTLAGTAIALALAGHIWMPTWLDERVRDTFTAVSVTASWLLFEGAYREEARVGAAVHLASAFFYAGAAITDRSTTTLGRLLDVPGGARVRLASGWLYAAGLTAVLGYLDMLRSLPAAENAEGGTMAMTFLFAAIAFAAAGAIAKLLRPDFRLHLYVMSLAVALVSLATGPSAGELAVVLGVYVTLYAALALYEDQPLLGVPAVVFGIALVPAWREHADATWAAIPAAYSAIAIGAAAAAALETNRKPWAHALGAATAAYAMAAPIVGFLLLAGQMDDVTGLVDGIDFYRTALYQVSTLSMAIAGVLALAAAYAFGRRWIFVPASAVLMTALLLQIGHYNPTNPQAYTVVIGAYLVGLGLLGLWKFRLVPEFEGLAPLVEGLGAAIIMLPSFVQSIDAGWRYQWILLAESVVFLTASIVLRRRGMLAAGVSAMVLVAGRTMVDAVNALPNWMIVAVAGSALLAIGMGILIGRDRWSKWQEALMGWWDETGNEHPAG